VVARRARDGAGAGHAGGEPVVLGAGQHHAQLVVDGEDLAAGGLDGVAGVRRIAAELDDVLAAGAAGCAGVDRGLVLRGGVRAAGRQGRPDERERADRDGQGPLLHRSSVGACPPPSCRPGSGDVNAKSEVAGL
jgi:hypothetical protein